MALHAVTEVAVHIGCFRNVDLFHQGLYRLQCRIFQDFGEHVVNAVPHLVEPRKLSGRPKEASDAGTLPGGSPARTASSRWPTEGRSGVPVAAVVESQGAFRTKAFVIRYCEEEVEVNNIGRFRIEQDMNASVPLTLEMTLMFADIQGYGGPEAFEVGNSPRQPPEVLDSEFSVRSTQLFRLHGTLQGLHAYCPVIFDEFHFCQVGLMVHSLLVDFRLRLRRDTPSFSPHLVDVPDLASLDDALVQLADEAEHEDTVDDEELEKQLPRFPTYNVDTDEGRLAKAVDCVQVRYVSRLAAARKDTVAFLEKIALLRSGTKQDFKVSPFVFPGRETPASAADSSSAGVLPPEPLSGRLSRINAPLAARMLAEDFSSVSGQVLEVWQLLLFALPQCATDVAELLRRAWQRKVVELCRERIVREVCPASDIAIPSDREIWTTHARIAEERRTSHSFQRHPSSGIEDMSMSLSPEEQPILFEQTYMPDGPQSMQPPGNASAPAAPEDGKGRGPGVHLFVLVHGLQGNSADMRLLKNNIALLYPKNTLYLCSSVNEDNTETDIMQMGRNLAVEVKDFVRDWCPGRPELSLGRLSFIPFSMGGLIVRSALPLLEEYHDKLYTFLSFSTPHLGFLFATNSLVKMFLWLAKKFRKPKLYEQLSMTDAEDPNDSFLSKLAHSKGLEHFRHVALVSSYQDQYAPFESARIEVSSLAETDAKIGRLCEQLAHDIWDPVKVERVMRFDVNFAIPETNLDTMIGRAAHIQFIECQPLMKMFFHTYSYLFE
mmetsp:Transcript_124487/g.229420  ORF Transcript_124487/g.229420 Transcript_124487/m.229420 type:complete len:775 (-) Transcript_124487:159-2483(-)